MRVQPPAVETLDLQFPPPSSESGFGRFAPGYPVRIESGLPEASPLLGELFGAFQAGGASPPRSVYEIRRSRPRTRGFALRVKGKSVFVHKRIGRLLHELEWLVMNEVVFSPNPYFLIHAASVSRGGCAVLLPGSRRAGKTTLAIALVLRGWRYLSDDIAAVCPEPLVAVPFPRHFSIRKDVRDLLAALSGGERRGSWVRPLKPSLDRFFSPDKLWKGSLGEPARVTHVIFPHHRPGVWPKFVPIGRAAALRRLASHSWGIRQFGRRGVEILADLVEGAECGELWTGQVEETCELLEGVCGAGRRGVRP